NLGVLTLNNSCTELLFDPALIGKDQMPGLPQLVHQCTQLCLPDEPAFSFPSDNDASLFSLLPAELLSQISKSVCNPLSYSPLLLTCLASYIPRSNGGMNCTKILLLKVLVL